MKTFLKILFSLFFLGILSGTIVASLDRGIGQAISELWPDPWFKVTIYDTYFTFFTVYVWMAYKERTMVSRVVWFVLVVLLGTFAISAYILIQLFKLKEDESIEKVLLRNHE